MKQINKTITAAMVAVSLSLTAGIAAAVECDEDVVASVKKIYKKNCKKCHGKKGNGKGPGAKDMVPAPPNWTADTDMSDDDRIKAIMEGTTKDGKPTEMKGWAAGVAKKGKEVSDEQAAALVCKIHTFKK